MKSVRVLESARKDLVAGFWFYEEQSPGLGGVFLSSIYADLDFLGRIAGVHRRLPNGLHRMIASRFPYAIYYRMDADAALVNAIVDCRRAPDWIREHIKNT